MKIAFLGTPDFAIPSLKMLIESGHDIAVFTQPDRPVGRHGTPVPPPVKELAVQNGIPVFQFEKIRSEDGVAALKAFSPDLMVTAAFGQLLSQENLDIPKYGCINVHGSLLPKYRGAAPIQWAVINGEKETGVTTMLTELGLDSGDILMQKSTLIDPDETSGELYSRLSFLGADLLKETLAALQQGSLTRTKQDEAESTKCSTLKKENGKIDFHLPSGRIHDLVRGTNPWPCAYAMLDGNPVKIWKTKCSCTDNPVLPVGTCTGNAKQGLFVQCGDGQLEILELQATNGKRMEAKTFLCGKQLDGKILQ